MPIPADLLKRIKENDPKLKTVEFDHSIWLPDALNTVEDLKQLKEALKGNTHAKVLNLSKCNLGKFFPKHVAEFLECLKETNIQHVDLSHNHLFEKLHIKGGLLSIVESLAGSKVKRLDLSQNKLLLYPPKNVIDILQALKKTYITTLDWNRQLVGGEDSAYEDCLCLNMEHLYSLTKGLNGTSITCLNLNGNGLGLFASVRAKQFFSFIQSLKETPLKSLGLQQNDINLLSDNKDKIDYLGSFIQAFNHNIISLDLGVNSLSNKHFKCLLTHIPTSNIIEIEGLSTNTCIDGHLFKSLLNLLTERKKVYEVQQKLGFLFGLHKRVGKDSTMMALETSPIFERKLLNEIFTLAFDRDAEREKEKVMKKYIDKKSKAEKGKDSKKLKDTDLRERKETKERKQSRH